MTGREYINKEKPDLVDNWSYPADLLSYGQIADMLEEYHQAKLKLLGIDNVVGRSEQLRSTCDWCNGNNSTHADNDYGISDLG